MIEQQALDNAVNLMELEFYRVKRYKVPITVAIIESNCKDLFNKIIKNAIRLSDLYQYLDKNNLLIIFDHLNDAKAKQVLNKIADFMKSECKEHLYIGYSEVTKTDEDSLEVITRALEALKLAKVDLEKDNIIKL